MNCSLAYLFYCESTHVRHRISHLGLIHAKSGSKIDVDVRILLKNSRQKFSAIACLFLDSVDFEEVFCNCCLFLDSVDFEEVFYIR